MIAIVAVDDSNGMMFNHRRQSQDRVMREKILEMAAQGKLWMNNYSAKQFAEADAQIVVDDDFADKAGAGDFCFFEDAVPDVRKVERLVLFKWNRAYPADLYFDIDLSGWMLEKSGDFEGSSHNMTMEVYTHAIH